MLNAQNDDYFCDYDYRVNINDPDEFDDEDRILLNSLILEFLVSCPNPNWSDSGPDPLNPFTTYIEYKYDIIGEHTQWGDQNATIANHQNEQFLSWHRSYIKKLEDWLLEQGHDQFVPLPYWNPVEAMPPQFYNQMIPEYLESGINTNGNPNQSSGTATYLAPPDMTWGSAIFFDENDCAEYPTGDEYGNFLANSSMHSPVHFLLGGAYTSQAATSGTTIFWLHHALFDQYYYCYQVNCQCPTIEVSASQSICEYCIDIEASETMDVLELELINEEGISTSITLDENGCIPIHDLPYGSLQTIRVHAINSAMLDNIDCPNATQENSFRVPTPPIKYDPCNGIVIGPGPGDPTSIGSVFFNVKNTGDAGLMSFYNSSLHSATTHYIDTKILQSDEELLIKVPTSALFDGVNVFTVETGTHIASHTYVR